MNINSLNFSSYNSSKKNKNGRLLIFIIFAITLRIATIPTANASYFIIAAFALLGRTQAIQALALSWLFTMVNPALAPETSAASIGRYAVILSAATSVAWLSIKSGDSFTTKKMNLITIYLCIFLIIHSILFSSVVDVSILKIISWMVVMLTLLSAWQGLTPEDKLYLFKQLQLSLILIVIFSIPLAGIPSIGYQRNGTGFQGLLAHPQVFGPTVALVGAMVGGNILGEYKTNLYKIFFLVLCFALVIMSEARTAGAALFLGLLGSALLSPFFARTTSRSMLPGLRNYRLQGLIFIFFICIILTGPLFADKFSNYLYKRSDASTLLEAADASRGNLVKMMMSNIQEKPFTGIGFGIASEPNLMEIERDPFLGLPLSALVEKGVLPIAVMEELGIFGFLVVLTWILAVFRRGAIAGVQKFSILITLVLVNFGESMFFSVGGMGMMLMIILTGAITGEKHIIRNLPHA